MSLKVRSPWKHGWQSCVGPLPSQEWAWRCSLFRSPSWKTDAKQCAGGWSKRSVLHLTVIRKSAPCARQRKRYRLSFVLRYWSFVISCPCARGHCSKENGQRCPFPPLTRCLCYCGCRADENNPEIVWGLRIFGICSLKILWSLGFGFWDFPLTFALTT